jgi:hypothetical protein
MEEGQIQAVNGRRKDKSRKWKDRHKPQMEGQTQAVKGRSTDTSRKWKVRQKP